MFLLQQQQIVIKEKIVFVTNFSANRISLDFDLKVKREDCTLLVSINWSYQNLIC